MSIKEALRAKLFKLVADYTVRIRAQNGGRVPSDIFGSCCDIGGAGTSSEVLIEVIGEGHALKLRDATDTGWRGEYHIIGTTWIDGVTHDGVDRKLEKELFGERNSDLRYSWKKRRIPFGEYITDESPHRRKTSRITVELLRVSLQEFREDFDGVWVIVPYGSSPHVPTIWYHQRLLRWANDVRRMFKADLRREYG